MGSWQRRAEEGIDTRIAPPSYNPRKPNLAKGQNKGKRGKVTISQVATLVDDRIARKRTIKYFETSNTGQPMTTGFQAIGTTYVPQGDGQGQRIADTIWVQRLEVRADVTLANADVYGLARVGFFKWVPSNALAVPDGSEIFQTYTTNPVLSFFCVETREYYRIFADETLNLSGTATNPTAFSQHWLSRTLELGGVMVQYDLGVTTGTGHIFMYWVSDSTVVPHPLLEYNVRIWYYDE